MIPSQSYTIDVSPSPDLLRALRRLLDREYPKPSHPAWIDDVTRSVLAKHGCPVPRK